LTGLNQFEPWYCSPSPPVSAPSFPCSRRGQPAPAAAGPWLSSEPPAYPSATPLIGRPPRPDPPRPSLLTTGPAPWPFFPPFFLLPHHRRQGAAVAFSFPRGAGHSSAHDAVLVPDEAHCPPRGAREPHLTGFEAESRNHLFLPGERCTQPSSDIFFRVPHLPLLRLLLQDHPGTPSATAHRSPRRTTATPPSSIAPPSTAPHSEPHR
jgi:hypothetical protein